MQYSYKIKSNLNFAETLQKTKDSLLAQSFGILTEINVRETLQKKLSVDYDDYVILGACNPPFAYEALKTEKEIGLFLPCNIIVYSDQNETFVSTILPSVAMSMIENENLEKIASQVEEKLRTVLDNIS